MAQMRPRAVQQFGRTDNPWSSEPCVHPKHPACRFWPLTVKSWQFQGKDLHRIPWVVLRYIIREGSRELPRAFLCSADSQTEALVGGAPWNKDTQVCCRHRRHTDRDHRTGSRISSGTFNRHLIERTRTFFLLRRQVLQADRMSANRTKRQKDKKTANLAKPSWPLFPESDSCFPAVLATDIYGCPCNSG